MKAHIKIIYNISSTGSLVTAEMIKYNGIIRCSSCGFREED